MIPIQPTYETAIVAALVDLVSERMILLTENAVANTAAPWIAANATSRTRPINYAPSINLAKDELVSFRQERSRQYAPILPDTADAQRDIRSDHGRRDRFALAMLNPK